MKLFVWYDVLGDWTGGIAFALAHDEDEARKVILQGLDGWELGFLASEIAGPPTVYDKPIGIHLHGGS